MRWAQSNTNTVFNSRAQLRWMKTWPSSKVNRLSTETPTVTQGEATVAVECNNWLDPTTRLKAKWCPLDKACRSNKTTIRTIRFRRRFSRIRFTGCTISSKLLIGRIGRLLKCLIWELEEIWAWLPIRYNIWSTEDRSHSRGALTRFRASKKWTMMSISQMKTHWHRLLRTIESELWYLG